MIITIDSREQRPFSFERWGVQLHKAKLPVGDYSMPGQEYAAVIERKEINDLVACLQGENRERFKRELNWARMCDLFVVIVESSVSDLARGRYKSQMQPEAAMQSIAALYVRFGTPFLFADSRAGAEYWTYSLLSKHLRELQKRHEKAQREAVAT
jgi:ERCC4-type nuclease